MSSANAPIADTLKDETTSTESEQAGIPWLDGKI